MELASKSLISSGPTSSPPTLRYRTPSSASNRSGTSTPSEVGAGNEVAEPSRSSQPAASHQSSGSTNGSSGHPPLPPSSQVSAGRSSGVGTRVEFSTEMMSVSARENSPSSSNGPDRESIPDLWDNTSEMSGYSAHSGKIEDVENIQASYFVRLVKFYQKYNADKLCRVEEFLAAYKGEEEQLFAILVEKYGPEPEAVETTQSDSSYFHAITRNVVPKYVTAQEGKTSGNTPYWPMSSAVTDPDLIALLHKQSTPIEDLRKCFIGVQETHPKDSWNGMTYITEEDLPSDNGQPFLGHLWSGSLANNKVLTYNKQSYHRCVLHCSDACQKSYPHARWRLTMIRNELDKKVLLRTVWDPIIRGGGARPPQSSLVKKDQVDSKPFFSFSWARKKSQQSRSPNGGPPSARGTPVSVSSSDASQAISASPTKVHRREQPQQPQPQQQAPPVGIAPQLIERLVSQMQQMESRLTEKLNSMDRRLHRVELMLSDTNSDDYGGGEDE